MDQSDSYPSELLSSNNRYSRQMVLPQIGLDGQNKLLKSAVLIVGCGALGSAQAELLTRAGVGRIVIADRDVLELHNLQRQLLFDELDVAEHLPKAVAAARKLRRINCSVTIEEVVTDVTPSNIEKLIEHVDLVLDGTDNFETRYLINDACIKAGKPWVYGGVLGTTGIVMAIDSARGPCFRCVLPQQPNASALPTCETLGVLNTAVLWVAALQVTEAFKLLLGNEFSEHFLRAVDLWAGSFTSMRVVKDDRCACCSDRHFEYLEAERGSWTTVLCGRNAVQVSPAESMEVSFKVLGEKLSPFGPVSVNGLVLECKIGEQRMIIFPDGRVLVMGTTDPSLAKTLVARYIGS
jgi:adenylyltransferase/sulfurtransferase